jgi:hypothetical protein
MAQAASLRAPARALTVAALVGTALVLGAGPASADPSAVNGHNCAGAVVSTVAGPGFGATVAEAAQAQVVDNLGLANCGQPPRRNP